MSGTEDAYEGLFGAPKLSGGSQNGTPPALRDGMPGDVIDQYPYEDPDGNLLFEVVRKKGKKFCQWSYLPDHPDAGKDGCPEGYVWGRSKHGIEPVLYQLPDVLRAADRGEKVFIVEGERDVHTLESWGHVATTNPQGVGEWKDEFSEALKGAHVVILPDNDKPGREHAEHVARSVFPYAASVRIVELPDLPEKGDVSDWREADGTAGELRKIVRDTEPLKRPPSSQTEQNEQTERGDAAAFVPFPVDALPGPVADYVRASAAAVGCAEAMVAVPILPVLASALGSAARLRLKRSWKEPTPLWTVVVAPSGSAKSPALSHALRLVYKAERDAKGEYEKKLKTWKNNDEEGEKPVRRRHRTGDATPEAIMKLLGENPRGLLLARNELGAWLGSFDRYVHGSADLQFFISCWDGMQASRDRAGDGNVTVSNPALSVTGTIQPGVLREKLSEVHFESGFGARLILCAPPTPPMEWSEADVTEEVENEFKGILDGLRDVSRGTEVGLTQAAKKRWVRFYNETNRAAAEIEDGPARAVCMKSIRHAARLALVLHLARVVKAGETAREDVDGRSMHCALTVAKWLRDETLRVYEALNIAHVARSPYERFLRELPQEFETSEAKALHKTFDVTERAVEKWLGKGVERGDLERIRHGKYRK